MGFAKRILRNLTLKTPKSYGYKAVDEVRDRLLKLDYERFPEKELARRTRSLMAAVISNEIEDSYRTPEKVAFDQMRLDMRIPAGPTSRQASDWWLELVMQPDSDMSRRFAYMRHVQGEVQPQRQYRGTA